MTKKSTTNNATANHAASVAASGINAELIARGIELSLNTEQAAAALNRKPQTLRKWACLECGPIRPIRVCRRLAWRVSDIQSLLGQESQ